MLNLARINNALYLPISVSALIVFVYMIYQTIANREKKYLLWIECGILMFGWRLFYASSNRYSAALIIYSLIIIGIGINIVWVKNHKVCILFVITICMLCVAKTLYFNPYVDSVKQLCDLIIYNVKKNEKVLIITRPKELERIRYYTGLSNIVSYDINLYGRFTMQSELQRIIPNEIKKFDKIFMLVQEKTTDIPLHFLCIGEDVSACKLIKRIFTDKRKKKFFSLYMVDCKKCQVITADAFAEYSISNNFQQWRPLLDRERKKLNKRGIKFGSLPFSSIPQGWYCDTENWWQEEAGQKISEYVVENKKSGVLLQGYSPLNIYSHFSPIKSNSQYLFIINVNEIEKSQFKVNVWPKDVNGKNIFAGGIAVMKNIYPSHGKKQIIGYLGAEETLGCFNMDIAFILNYGKVVIDSVRIVPVE